MPVAPRAVVIDRPTELEELLDRHGTHGQVEFFLQQRGRSPAEAIRRDHLHHEAMARVDQEIPAQWRRSRIRRADLDRWMFAADDVVIVVGPDGLVANVAKYLDGQPVVGVNPDPNGIAGVLVRHSPARLSRTLEAVAAGVASIESRVMVEALVDDGQRLSALNEVFVGHASHQSSRYTITLHDGRFESQSSSGVLVGTGTGSTGWCRSISNDRGPVWDLPDQGDQGLAWFVREAWPSDFTGVELTGGLLDAGKGLTITASSDTMVIFGDGIESDRLELSWGQDVVLRESDRRLQLVVPTPRRGRGRSGSRSRSSQARSV